MSGKGERKLPVNIRIVSIFLFLLGNKLYCLTLRVELKTWH